MSLTICCRSGLLAGERHCDLLARLCPTPNVKWLVALEDHVGLEDVADAKTFRNGRHFDNIFARHLLCKRGTGMDK